MIKKHGESLPINVIVILIIALVVLAIILFIFGDKAGLFQSSTKITCTCNEFETDKAGNYQCDDGEVAMVARLKLADKEECEVDKKDYKNGDIVRCCRPVELGS